jgi:hypothetical protein
VCGLLGHVYKEHGNGIHPEKAASLVHGYWLNLVGGKEAVAVEV